MADNIDIKDAGGVTKTVRTTDTNGSDLHIPLHRPDTPTTHTRNSTASLNAINIKASAGVVYGVTVSNVNAAQRFLKLYNIASAPTVGTTVPVLTIPIPANTVVSVNFGTLGMAFGTGIGIGMTTGAADGDTAAVAANDIKMMMAYI